MKLYVIDTGFFKLDGGAMFGVVPKSIWQQLNPADENNLCTWAMRCLLVEEGKRLMLVDTGIGNKQDAKFFSYYYLHGEASLMGSIQKAGFTVDQVTDVILTHLHFDHVGGAVERRGEKLWPAFPNARYWTNAKHWLWAMQPNPREKASFLSENLLPLKESGQLNFLDSATSSPFECLDFIFVNGHTEAMMLPRIKIGGKTLVYMADLIPSSAHIPVPYLMGYDVRPLLTMEEKGHYLKQAVDQEWILMFEHDPLTECATVKMTDKGVRLEAKGRLADWF
jgi:glyoxylase-like metal-dependent hydrolase (beta-lactamase superfamily II)